MRSANNVLHPRAELNMNGVNTMSPSKPGIWTLPTPLNHHAGMRTLFWLLPWCRVLLGASQDSPKLTPSMANSIKPIYLKTYHYRSPLRACLPLECLNEVANDLSVQLWLEQEEQVYVLLPALQKQASRPLAYQNRSQCALTPWLHKGV